MGRLYSPEEIHKILGDEEYSHADVCTVMDDVIPVGETLDYNLYDEAGLSQMRHKLTVTNCSYCEVVAHLDEADVVMEWTDALAIRPLHPAAPGHIVVMSKQHYCDAIDNPRMTGRVFQLASMLAERPCTIMTVVGRAATQQVMHLHAHVIPVHG